MNLRTTSITMGDVASQAGVARSTVSRALRDDPAIPEKTCAKIKRLAEKIGYRPNPLVSTLMAQMHDRRRRGDPCNIAWVDLWPKTSRPPSTSRLKELLIGAQRRAHALGYGIEVHRADAEPLQIGRLRQILLARAQWGFIVPPVPEHAKHIALEMRGLAGVTIGTSLNEPNMHRVHTNHFNNAQLGWRALHGKGFQRIGLALSPEMNERHNGQWLGGYVSAQAAGAQGIPVPPLLVSESEPSKFQIWLREHRPDAVLLADPFISTWLQTEDEQNRARPAIVWLGLVPEAKKAWGIDYRAEMIGALAVDMVVAQIHRNERGCPTDPHTVMFDGVWAEK